MDNASETNTHRLNPPVNDRLDHVLGDPAADITLVEYGSYNCPSCCAANEVIANLRDRFGERGAMYSATGLSPKRGCAARRRAGAVCARDHRPIRAGARGADEAWAGSEAGRFRRGGSGASAAAARCVARRGVITPARVACRHGPSEPALRELDAIHDRIESPASKLLRSVEP